MEDNRMDKSEMLKDVLLKEYDTMRTEIRMYINKYYIAITLIYTILSAGLLKNDPTQSGGIIYIWIPYIIAAIIGFMTMITFFVSKMAGYIRLIELRISKIFDTVPPDIKSPLKAKLLLAPLFWENTYADIDIERDKGRQLISPFFISILIMVVSALLALGIIMYYGYQIASQHQFIAIFNGGHIYLITSTLLLMAAIALFPIVNSTIRRKTIAINNALMEKFELIDYNDQIGEIECPAKKHNKPSKDEENDGDLIDPLA